MRVFNRARTLPDVVRDLFSDSAIVEAMLGLRCTYMLNILVELGCGDDCLAKTVEVLNHTNVMEKLKLMMAIAGTRSGSPCGTSSSPRQPPTSLLSSSPCCKTMMSFRQK